MIHLRLYDMYSYLQYTISILLELHYFRGGGGQKHFAGLAPRYIFAPTLELYGKKILLQMTAGYHNYFDVCFILPIRRYISIKIYISLLTT